MRWGIVFEAPTIGSVCSIFDGVMRMSSEVMQKMVTGAKSTVQCCTIFYLARSEERRVGKECW